ncbi:MAG: hypothetical protein ACYDBW_07940 [Sulfuricaulis sp.]
MKLVTIVFLLMTVVFSVRAAEVETDCRDYDGGLHAEAMRLKMLESSDASRDNAAPVFRDKAPASVPVGDRVSGGNEATGKEK